MRSEESIRAAFIEAADPDATGERWSPEVGPALARVHERARRTAVRRRAAATGLAAAVLVVLAGIVAGNRQDGSPDPLGPPTGEDAVEPASTPLDGAWRLGPVTSEQLRTTLRDAELENWWAALRKEFPATPVRYRMNVAGGALTLWVRGSHGSGWVKFDEERITVTDDQLLLEPVGAVGASRYQWQMEDGRLRLGFLSSSEGRAEDLPNAAFQRTLYTVDDWTRSPDG